MLLLAASLFRITSYKSLWLTSSTTYENDSHYVLPNHRCVVVSNPFNPFRIQSRRRRHHRKRRRSTTPSTVGEQGGYIISGVEVSSFVCSQLRRFHWKHTPSVTHDHCYARGFLVSKCTRVRPTTTFLLSLRFFLNFVRYPLLSCALLRRFVSRPRKIRVSSWQKLKKRKRYTVNPCVTRSLLLGRSGGRRRQRNVKNRKLRDRLGSLFYAL